MGACRGMNRNAAKYESSRFVQECTTFKKDEHSLAMWRFDITNRSKVFEPPVSKSSSCRTHSVRNATILKSASRDLLYGLYCKVRSEMLPHPLTGRSSRGSKKQFATVGSWSHPSGRSHLSHLSCIEGSTGIWGAGWRRYE
jgi:hypothetical protein